MHARHRIIAPSGRRALDARELIRARTIENVVILPRTRHDLRRIARVLADRVRELAAGLIEREDRVDARYAVGWSGLCAA